MNNAQLFCDAMAARRWHQRMNPRGVVPASLEIEAIKRSHLLRARGDNQALLFMDESLAQRNSDGIWTVT